MSTQQTVGERIRRYRHTNLVGIETSRVADAAGIAAERLELIEADEAEPTRDEIVALALTLGVSANDLRPGTTIPVIFPEGLTVDEKVALVLDDRLTRRCSVHGDACQAGYDHSRSEDPFDV